MPSTKKYTVLVSFVRKTTRDQLPEQHFNTKLWISNSDIIVLKEIPTRGFSREINMLFDR